MATIVLQAVGSAVGGALGGPVGAVIGRTLGAIGGSYIDNQLFGPGDQVVEGPRLEGAQVLSSRDGATIPKVFGSARISGEIIWATHFNEVQQVQKTSQGGKGGGPTTSVSSYSYYANFAIGLCEGEIACIRRIWADGRLLDQTEHTIRPYKGTDDQALDSLIEAKQGTGNAPAFRGLAYVVFENFPLEEYGNRIPQIAVEVVRCSGRLERHIHAVNVIPGATEFGYDTVPAIDQIDETGSVKLNVNQEVAQTDFIASLDELIALCPNLKQVALVVAWFGDDLRAGECTIRPKVETASRRLLSSSDWTVAGLNRSSAELVTMRDGSPAYGGTPSDASVLNAIAAIKERGLKVCLNPFVLMDISEDNQLPDPYGNQIQSSHPWRGRITCFPAAGQSGSVDGSEAAAQQVSNFIGQTSVSGSASASDWSYRRMILHYADLATEAGGLDLFLIGSELRGLTTIRGANDEFPFVDALCDLADDVAAHLGPDCLVTYGADWSEYFGFQPQDGQSNVYYHLDKLWSRASVGAVGIDNYMPLSDWRSTEVNVEEGRSTNDRDMLSSQIEAGEGYDWYYADVADRVSRNRSPITDGLGKPWIYRYKDIRSWWSNLHTDRRGGVELAQPTSWVPQSKPIVFTEFGCPAVHNGATQPNVFVDAKSSESALPYFSDGGRDDQAQVAYLEAHQAHWDATHEGFSESNNPVSLSYSGRMVEFEKSQLWAWDARPYPYFPALTDVWSDAENWATGHWLNGRLGAARIADIIEELLLSAGLTEFDVSQVSGVLDGYVIADATSPRAALEALVTLYQIDIIEDAGKIIFRSPGYDDLQCLTKEDLDHSLNEPIVSRYQRQENDLPVSIQVQHIDPDIQYNETLTTEGRTDRHGNRQQRMSLPAVVNRQRMAPLAESWIREQWNGRETIAVSVSRAFADLTVGDSFVFKNDAASKPWKITKIETSDGVRLEARAMESFEHSSASSLSADQRYTTISTFSVPRVVFLDLPRLDIGTFVGGNMVGATASPWPGELAVYASPSTDGFNYRQSLVNSAFTGELLDDLPSTKTSGRWQYRDEFRIRLTAGSVSSLSDELVFNNANAVAVRSKNDEWEIVQFGLAELVDPQTWLISKLLRGQAGTEPEALSGAEAGSSVVVLNSALEPLAYSDSERGLPLNWTIGPAGKALGGASFTTLTNQTGYREFTPYRPVHLSCSQLDQEQVEVRWFRRDRIGSDDWSPLDIPMSEASETYQVALSFENGESFNTIATTAACNISASDWPALTQNIGQTLTIEVAQISTTTGAGPSAQIQIIHQ